MRLHRPSPALVVAIVALVVAMTGTAVAATLITGKQVKNSSLTGADIKNSSLTGSDVKNRSLTPADFSGSVTGPRGAPGPTGATGPQGPAGPTVVNQLNRVVATKTIGAGAVDSVSVTCPPGQGVVSGGFQDTGADAEVFFADTFGSSNTWAVGLDNFDSTLTATIEAVAFCAPSGQAAAPRSVDSGVQDQIVAAVAAQRATH